MGFQKNVFLFFAAVTLVLPAFAHADEFSEFNSMGVNHRSSQLSNAADSNYDRIESEIKGFGLTPPPQVRKAKRAPASDPMFDRATNQKVDPVAEDHLADRDIDSFMRDQDQAEKDARDEYNRVHHIKASKTRIAHRKLSRRNVSTLSNKASLLDK